MAVAPSGCSPPAFVARVSARHSPCRSETELAATRRRRDTSGGAEPRPRRLPPARGTRPRDAALDFAWATAATIEPWHGGRELLPEDHRRHRSCTLIGAHPHVRLARGRDRSGDRRPAETEAGAGRRGARARRRYGSQAVQADSPKCSPTSPRPGPRSSSTTCSRSTGDGLYPGRPETTIGDRTRSAMPSIASCTSSTVSSPSTAIAGIRDHFVNGGYHDVMVGVTGDIVRQAQAAFLTSFKAHGGPLARGTVRRTSPSRPIRAPPRSSSRRSLRAGMWPRGRRCAN